MQDKSIPVLILSDNPDDAEQFNKTLRSFGHAVRCRHLSTIEDLIAALNARPPHLLIAFRDRHETTINEVAALRQHHAPMTPLIVVADTVDEDAIGDALAAGAQDLVSFRHAERLRAVCERELKTNRLERALSHALVSTEEYRSEVQSLLSHSAEALAVVQEGIVVDSNQAWNELFNGPDAEAVAGPLMDLFAPESQAAVRDALVACQKKRGHGEPIAVDALDSAGGRIPGQLSLEPSFHDGEPAIRVGLQPEPDETAEPDVGLTAINAELDPATGFLNRKAFLQKLTDILGQRRTRGARALAYIRPDKFKQIEATVGPVLIEDIIAQVGAVFGRHMEEGDVAGRLDGIVTAVVLERDSLDAISDWGAAVLKEIGKHVFEVAELSLSLTCSIGFAEIGTEDDDLVALLQLAENANQRCRQDGGNAILIEETTDASTLIRRADSLWTQRIKAALVDNRFRLVTFNIASLSGASDRMFETFVRMIDEQGDEVQTSEFMGSAQRNKLLRPIDRWVIDASYKYCADNACDVVFVKLSAESVLDAQLPAWAVQQLAQHRIRPANICFQVCEDDAARHMKQTRALAELLRKRGFKFAIENFGIGRDPLSVLNSTPVDYIKFDGSLMKQMLADSKLQDKVRNFASQASRRGVASIATHVENANTMAVLFQLGVGFMQGHYVQEPEVILEEAV